LRELKFLIYGHVAAISIIFTGRGNREMGLPMRITFNDQDFVYQIVNSNLINQNTTELELLLNGEKLQLIKEKTIWIQKDGDQRLDPQFIQALGRSVSLRLRM
jgi:hypothetical protein